MQFISYFSLKKSKISPKTRRKLAEISHTLNPWGSKAQDTFFLNLALGTIWGVVVAPPDFRFFLRKNPPNLPHV